MDGSDDSVAQFARVTVRRRLAASLAALAVVLTLTACDWVNHGGGESTTTPSPTQSRTPTTPTGATSFELIQSDVAAGRLTAYQGVLYEAYAQFGDQRLPQQYRGDDSKTDETFDADLDALWPSMTDAQRKEIEPFTLPAYVQGSWWDLAQPDRAVIRGSAPQVRAVPRIARAAASAPTQPGCVGAGIVGISTAWHSFTAVGGKVRVWYTTNAAYARNVAQAAEDAWPVLSRVMGQEPLPDAGTPCEGGDKLYDVVVQGSGVTGAQYGDRGVTASRAGGCSHVASFTSIGDNKGAARLDMSVAHELMHAFEYSFTVTDSCDHRRWWAEATAAWSWDLVNPSATDEHAEAAIFFKNPDTSLWDQASVKGRPDAVGYPAYVYPFFIAHTEGNATIGTIWAAMANSSVMDAIDKTVTDGLQKQWPEFADRNWNRDPFTDYHAWDQLDLGMLPVDPAGKLQAADYEYDLALGGASYDDVKLAVAGVPGLAARYFTFKFSDPNARWIDIYPGQFIDSAGNPDIHASVHALLKIGGRWSVQKWSGPLADDHYFCRDDSAEALQEVVLVYSNSSTPIGGGTAHALEQTPDPDTPAHIALSSMPCGLTLTASGGTNYKDDVYGDLPAQIGTTDFAATTMARTSSSTPPLEYEATTPIAATWTFSGTMWMQWILGLDLFCIGSGGGVVQLPTDEGTLTANWNSPDKEEPTMTVGFAKDGFATGDLSLQDAPGTPPDKHCPATLPGSSGGVDEVDKADGSGEVKGTHSNNSEQVQNSETWDVAPK